MMVRRIRPEPVRVCAAERCRSIVNRGELMCRAHWLSLPMNLRKSILFSFRHGWERDYRDYVAEAVDLIAQREGTYSEISFGKVSETQPCPAGDGQTHTSPSPANLVFIPFLGVAN